MYSNLRSHIFNNSMIFIGGMLCSFTIFSFVVNDTPVTANIGDVFPSNPNKEKQNFVLSLDKNNILSLESTINILSGTGKSLRISLLYNDTLKDIITKYLQSPYKFSFINKNNSLIILIDIDEQNIEEGKKLFLLPLALDNITLQNIPIIESVQLFDESQIDILSVENTINTSIHH